SLLFNFESLLPAPSSLSIFDHPATTATCTLSLHDALPISDLGAARRALSGRLLLRPARPGRQLRRVQLRPAAGAGLRGDAHPLRSEEHTSELQSRENLVCRLLLEKKKTSIERT